MKNILLRFHGIHNLVFLALLLVLTSFVLLTERTIEGVVLSDTREPLPFANVFMEGTSTRTYRGERGDTLTSRQLVQAGQTRLS